MSKASEWAAAAKETERKAPPPTEIGGYRIACAFSGYAMTINWRIPDGIYAKLPDCTGHTFQFKAEDALALARWIQDTFGDEQP